MKMVDDRRAFSVHFGKIFPTSVRLLTICNPIEHPKSQIRHRCVTDSRTYLAAYAAGQGVDVVHLHAIVWRIAKAQVHRTIDQSVEGTPHSVTRSHADVQRCGVSR